MTDLLSDCDTWRTAFATALRPCLREIAASGQPRGFVTRILPPELPRKDRDALLPVPVPEDEFTVTPIAQDSWLPALLTLSAQIIETPQDIAVAARALSTTATAIETQFAFCLSGQVLEQLGAENPFVTAIDALNDTVARLLGRACLIEAFVPLGDDTESVGDRLFLVALKVMR